MYVYLCHSSGGHLEAVTYLVTTGIADIYSMDDYEKTPLYWACVWVYSIFVISIFEIYFYK